MSKNRMQKCLLVMFQLETVFVGAAILLEMFLTFCVPLFIFYCMSFLKLGVLQTKQ